MLVRPESTRGSSITPGTNEAKIRWAPRLRPRLLQRLYFSDAKGVRDLDLCTDVGFRLFERCRTFSLVSRREVECPLCGRVFAVAPDGQSPCPNDACTWSTTDRAYRESLRNHYAHTGRAIDAFDTFHRSYPAAQTYAERILLIDQLIHSFHLEEKTEVPVKSVASKLLEGNKLEVVLSLDQLSARDPSQKNAWRKKMAGTIHGRVVSPDGHEE